MKYFIKPSRSWFSRSKALKIAVTFVMAFGGLSAQVGAMQPAAAPQPVLRVTTPARVELGASIPLTLTLEHANDLAGYETQLLFDTSAAEFDGLHQRKNDLPRFGRDVSPLGPVELLSGIAFGFYSCPVPQCVDHRHGTRQAHGANGTVRLGTVVLRGTRAGTVELQLAGATFVTSDGAAIAVTLPAPLHIQVGAPGAGPLFRAPVLLPVVGRHASSLAPGPFDLTGDGLVTHADAMEVALAWTRNREQGVSCGALLDSTRDVNHDGCVDVADLQLLAANYSPATAVAATHARSTLAHSLQPATLSAQATTVPTFTVNTAEDSNDVNIGDGICAASVTTTGKCTLRAAIQEANARSGPDTIAFAIPGSSVQTITLKSTLPTISDASGPTTIDGYTQPGATPNTDPLVSNAHIMVQIAGTGPTTLDAFVVTSAGNRIRGLAFYNLRRSIYLYGSGASDNVIVGNFVGTDAAATFVAATSVVNANGVDIEQGATRTQVGTPAPADRNVVSGNSRHGISTYYEGSDSNVIMNNIVGLGPLGNKRLANGAQGIDINATSSYNVIGGMNPGERNVLSGNLMSGVELSHDSLTVQNKIIGNYIGTDVNGTGAGSSYTTNNEWGVHVEDGVNNSLVANNVIGNSRLGGVKVENYDTIDNQFTNNRIGIGTDGSAIPNMRFGVQVAYHAQHQIIGPGNLITNNPIGVSIDYVDEDFNTITRNSIYNNTNLGIDLGPGTGVTANDVGDTDMGANNQVNFPVLTSATQYQATGTACAEASVPKPCTVEVFVAERLTSDQGAGAYGQGKTFVGSATTNVDGSFIAALLGVNVGDAVTATATDATGNTSEFSMNRVVMAGTPPGPAATSTPSPVSTTVTYAADTFSRNVTDGWGNADIGGGYAVEAPARPTVDYDINGFEGTMAVTNTNKYRSAFLPAVAAQDVDMRVRVKTDQQMTGGYGFVYLVARRVGTMTQYMGRLGIDANGNVFLQAARSSQTNGKETVTLLGSQVAVSGVQHKANQYLWVRVQAEGVSPTTLHMKVWADGQVEPPSWPYSVTDSTASLQAAGAVGLRAFVASGVTSVPILFTFDDFRVEAIATSSTTPTPTATPSPSSTPTSTLIPTVTPTDTLSPSSTPTSTLIPTVTPTDTPSPSSTPTSTLIPTPTPTTSTPLYVSDTFTRNVTGQWGSAPTGGNYALLGTNTDFSVDGSTGTMTMSAVNTNRAAYLPSVAARDVDATFRVKKDKLVAGGSQIVYFVARRVSSGTEYRGRLRFALDGRLMLQAERYTGGTQTLLGTETAVTGLSDTANAYIWLRVQVVGSNPTTIRLRAWADGQPEPSVWQFSVTDADPSLQGVGAVGLQAYLSSTATNAPVVFSFDDFRVTGPVTP